MFKLSGQTKLFLQYARLYNVDRSVQGGGDAHLRHKAANRLFFYGGTIAVMSASTK